ncbi:uncharacterized protein LOC122504602 [Leptopilina heterotoma]|uniref:uncharacterized protein LOC122504602 n=1 Tax=Leptopilina heterotoma TaxID=63436 RepID=UPI001CA7C8F5|nr:uncharacterized protein LOC122504602 [Leptopilina heterotoma]
MFYFLVFTSRKSVYFRKFVNCYHCLTSKNMRNIEIKAKVGNPEEFLVKVKEISDSKETVIPQRDVFFNLPKDKPGRLKLRNYQDGTGELIFYDRPDIKGPKLSSFEKTFLTSDACKGIEGILTTAYGTLGIVEKTRLLYMVGQTRIHVDQVKGLGSFMELEVVLADDESIEHGEKISNDLMDKLGITKDCLISGAYMDLLLKEKSI